MPRDAPVMRRDLGMAISLLVLPWSSLDFLASNELFQWDTGATRQNRNSQKPPPFAGTKGDPSRGRPARPQGTISKPDGRNSKLGGRNSKLGGRKSKPVGRISKPGGGKPKCLPSVKIWVF